MTELCDHGPLPMNVNDRVLGDSPGGQQLGHLDTVSKPNTGESSSCFYPGDAMPCPKERSVSQSRVHQSPPLQHSVELTRVRRPWTGHDPTNRPLYRAVTSIVGNLTINDRRSRSGHTAAAIRALVHVHVHVRHTAATAAMSLRGRQALAGPDHMSRALAPRKAPGPSLLAKRR